MIKFRHSVSFNITLFLVPTIILVMVLLGILFIFLEKQSGEKSLTDTANQTAERISNSLVYPLWNINEKETELTVLYEMANQNIQAIILKDNDQNIIMGKIRNAKWDIVDFKPGPFSSKILEGSFIHLDKTISKYQETIAYVHIYVTNHFLKKALKRMGLEVFILTFFLSVIIIITIYLSFSHTILKPLKLLENAVENFSRKDFSSSAPIIANNEIGRLANSFNNMANQLNDSFKQIELQLDEIEVASKDRELLLQELYNNNKALQNEIVERTRVENQLRESEEKYRNLFEFAPAGIVITSLNGHLYSQNDIFVKMFRVPDREMLSGISMHVFYVDPEKDSQEMIDLIQEKGFIENYEIDLKDFNGILFKGSISSKLIVYEGKTCVQSIIRDITRIKQMEAELRNYTQNLESMVDEKTKMLLEANKNLSDAIKRLEETQEQLAISAHQAGMAEIAVSILHNIGNAINSINVRVHQQRQRIIKTDLEAFERVYDLLVPSKMQPDSPDTNASKNDKLNRYFRISIDLIKDIHLKLKTDCDFMIKGLDHVIEIITLQQKYAGIKGFETNEDINELLNDALELLRDSIEKREISIELELSKLPPVQINKNKLIQIFINLIKNAYEAIDMSENQTVKKICFKTFIEMTDDLEYIYITIRDTGVGVDPKDLENVFRFQFSTKKRGTGFGLHDAANYIKAQKGMIFLKSDGLEQGSEMIIALPVNPGEFKVEQ